MTVSIMLQGTASDVGKSVLVAGLCRIFYQDGYRVAPFKSQNMALNSGITAAGDEMGRAQIFQAEAAGVEPDVRMNPILLKPSSDMQAQVVLMGKVFSSMDAQTYHHYKPQLMAQIEQVYRSLAAEHDIMVLEGAGSPAEINLRDRDIVNMGMAERIDAPVILVADIDRGGVFASIYGTLALLNDEERARVKGVIINKFRGDIALLHSGIEMIEQMTSVPVLGVMPFIDLNIEDEDSVGLSQNKYRQHGYAKYDELDIAVLQLPYLSNFTDFNPLAAQPDVHLRYVARGEAIGYPDLLIIPGSKNTLGDLSYLYESGLDLEIKRLAELGIPILGICGGYQMLGTKLYDGIESGIAEMPGLGLLECETRFAQHKVTTQVVGITASSPLFSDGLVVQGYEIHMGQTVRAPGVKPFCRLTSRNSQLIHEDDGAVSSSGNVMGSYIHGIFDEGAFTRSLLNQLRQCKDLPPLAENFSFLEMKQKEYDNLAMHMRAHIDIERIYQIMEQQSGCKVRKS
ncbi:cobyric acid synthase [Pragia fontium]|uniref:cobyric acid synthase n=1 Tax=Pragia fontium TaxID=82985 RepID=UPI000F6DFF73|nr:cobyric acid synthase [Pragia fontium]VEJ55707.1 Cobyric acid synthase [Pragia fontium]